MFNLLLLVTIAGLMPFALAVARLEPSGPALPSRPPAGSILLAALAFNLTFFWQELWLVIPKALTPGLAPVLYHNDHDWTGTSPIAELLQVTGAIATLVSGLAFAALLAWLRRLSPTWQVFAFWMAFQGLSQSLSQVAIGALVPGNDVGRALSYLGFGPFGRAIVLGAALVTLALVGRRLAALIPACLAPVGAFGTRRSARALGITAAALVLLSVPFRIPRNPVEVLLVPAIVNLIGMAWLLMGMTFVTRRANKIEPGPPAVVMPAAMLVALLIFFQIVLRPGVPLRVNDPPTPGALLSHPSTP